MLHRPAAFYYSVHFAVILASLILCFSQLVFLVFFSVFFVNNFFSSLLSGLFLINS